MTCEEIKPLEKITIELLLQQHHRILFLGTMKILTDVCAAKVYAVPTELSHKQFEEQLRQKGTTGKLIPAYINLEENRSGPFKITGILTGLSGAENAGEIKHEYADLQKAHQILWAVINASSPPLEILMKTNRIETKYAL